MSRRLLVLTAGFGEGHNAAALALAKGWDQLHGAGCARVADVFALTRPGTNAFSRRAYLVLINRAPGVWKSIYAWLDRSTVITAVLRSFRAEQRTLARFIAEEPPAAIACTYPVYAYWLQALARAGRLRVPYFNVVTDSITINSLWWRAGAAGWFVPNEDSAAVMRAAGVAPGKLHVLGFPVSPHFEQQRGHWSPPDLAAGAAPRVLYVINSDTRAAADIGRRLLMHPAWNLTCTVGRNDALRRELGQLARRCAPDARILGWTDEMPRLLMSHHVVVSKVGGATTQEALAARCPMIVNQIVPGQEEGNYELLRRHGIGALATTPDAVVAALQRAFAADAAVWQTWRAALAPLSRPNAAAEVAARVTEITFGHAESIPLPFRLAPLTPRNEAAGSRESPRCRAAVSP